MSSYRLTTTINTLPDNVFVEIFSLCRTEEVAHASWRHPPWEWHRLAQVCQTWRHIMFASSRHLHLELFCTHGTPVKKDLGPFPTFPIVISYFRSCFEDGDRDNLFAALEHHDRVRIIDITVLRSMLEELATVMREPYPVLKHLRFESEKSVLMPALTDTFLGGSAPCLQTIYMSGVPFPAAPTLLLSAHDLVDVHLNDIPPTGYISPEAMVASLAALPKLKYLNFGFEEGMTYPNRMRLHPITRTVLSALTIFYFDGLFEYFEDLVAQIDAPQLDCLGIDYLDQHEVPNFQIPELCRFIGRSEKLKLSLSQFRRADLHIRPYTVAVELVHRDQSFFLSVQEKAIGQVISQISAMLSNVARLFIHSDSMGYDGLGFGIRWLELFRPFTAVKALSVDDELSWHIPFALKDITGERVAEVLPALQLLYLENESVTRTSLKKFVAARQNVGRPVTVINEETEFEERLNTLDIGE